MIITSAKYQSFEGKNIAIEIKLADGKTWSTPLVEGNRHYDEIMKQVKAGTLTIKDAD